MRMPCFKHILKLSRWDWRKTGKRQGSWQWQTKGLVKKMKTLWLTFQSVLMVHGPREYTLLTMELFENRLRPIYERLSDPALLERYFPGFTQNANESVNSLAKIRCPKHKWHGRKRIELATASATLHFSAGATAKYEVMVRAGLAVAAGTRKESRRYSGRIKKAEKRIQDQHKKYRVARRKAKQRDEEQW